MNRRSITFGSGPYRGWRMSLDQSSPGQPVLVQLETAPSRALPRRYHAAMIVKAGSASHRAAEAGLTAGPGSPLAGPLTDILAELPGQAAVYGATPLQQTHIGLIAAAGVHARRDFERSYPDGEPAFEVVGELSAETVAAMIVAEDQAEDTDGLDPDDRVTCHVCKTLATGGHVNSGAHWSRLERASAGRLLDRACGWSGAGAATAALPRVNERPHNANGTTDDFYG